MLGKLKGVFASQCSSQQAQLDSVVIADMWVAKGSINTFDVRMIAGRFSNGFVKARMVAHGREYELRGSVLA